ncbi:MAG TPA: transglutaminase family protein [Chroococcidiopsis sp.]
MRYHITHITTYTYAQPVTLSPHMVRLRPRCDSTQSLHAFTLEVSPTPLQQWETVDLDGNSILRLSFADQAIARLTLKAVSEVETYRTNPFDFLLEPWAVHLPIDYPSGLRHQLQPYLGGPSSNFPQTDAIAIQLAHDLWHQTHGNPVMFLSQLCQQIYDTCQYSLRETGDPLPAGITWTEQLGSCRDLTILFMEVCRAMGLAARFVSGYHEGDPDWDERHLHAWAEVYLPGAGWRGYDPTQGLAVGDRHIALVASPNSRQTIPVAGALRSNVGTASSLDYQLTITAL